MATLDEIAKAAGVSRMTVSNVLNGKNKENWSSTADRAERIREIARELNYRPNSAAKAVVTGRFGSVGLLISRDQSSGALFDSTFRAIRTSLCDLDMHLTVGDLPDDALTSEGFMPKILREWAADGLLINYIASIPTRMVELIQRNNIPSIWLNTRLEADCVYPEDFAAAEQATMHLIRLGHKRIAFLQNAASSHYSASERENGYLKAMQGANLQPRIIGYESTVPIAGAQQYSREWLQQDDRPTAVLSYEANYAVPTLCAALGLGLSVPRDLSIVTIHDKSLANEYGLNISTMQIPGAEMGEIAVDMVLNKIKEPSMALTPKAVPFTFYSGETCAPVAQA